MWVKTVDLRPVNFFQFCNVYCMVQSLHNLDIFPLKCMQLSIFHALFVYCFDRMLGCVCGKINLVNYTLSHTQNKLSLASLQCVDTIKPAASPIIVGSLMQAADLGHLF